MRYYGPVTNAKDIVTKEYADRYATKYKTITLPVASWAASGEGYTQTATVTGVLADETKQLIQPVPKLTSQTAYLEAGVRATGQAANNLTFYADAKPTVALTVYVAITEVRT